MKASSKRFLSLVLILALLAVIVFIFSFLLKPVYEKVSALRGEYLSKKQTFSDQQSVVLKVQDVLRQYEDNLTELEKSASSIVTKGPQYDDLIYQVNAIAKNTGIFLVSFDFNLLPGKAVKSQGFSDLSTLQAKLQVRGKYESFKDFVKSLETNIRIMDVQNMSIFPDSKENNSYSVVLNTYYVE